jgi:uncharacterized protein (TIGR00304 family)
MRSSEDFLRFGAAVTFIGFILIFSGIIFTMLQHSENSRIGGLIMLGPIPIIFGSDKESAKTVTILAIILMLLSLLVLRGSFF